MRKLSRKWSVNMRDDLFKARVQIWGVSSVSRSRALFGTLARGHAES